MLRGGHPLLPKGTSRMGKGGSEGHLGALGQSLDTAPNDSPALPDTQIPSSCHPSPPKAFSTCLAV